MLYFPPLLRLSFAGQQEGGHLVDVDNSAGEQEPLVEGGVKA